MGYANIIVSSDGHVGVITLNRPAVFNCLTIETFDEIERAVVGFEESGMRAILLRAEGKHFCTGAELGQVKQVRQDPDSCRHFIATGHRVLKRLESSTLPVIAAIQGLCLAGGLELMLACDMVFAADRARFGDQHGQFGLVPGWGGSQRLPRIVGMRRAFDLFYSVRWIDAADAERWGLVNAMYPEDVLQTEALAFAHTIATRSRIGMASMKRLAREGLEGSLAAGLALEENALPDLLLADDVTEGLDAFENKRTPIYP